MKILFTGASSFTGHWFVTKLAERGHEVWATFTQNNAGAYGTEVRGQRVSRVLTKCHPVFSCRFGDDRFLKLLNDEKFDLLCHHAADVTNYRSPDFDVARAVANNTFRATDVLQSLRANGGSLLLTGSFFEPGEGAGSDGLPAFSPYGVSKRQTADNFQNECQQTGVRMGKFVIPNPFGPWEDPRFISYLARTWSAGQTAAVRTPDYIRDNIPVSLLTAAYVQFAEQLPHAAAFTKINPRGYVESQGAFSERVAREMRSRTAWKCELELAVQTVFDEPMERMNTDELDRQKLGWSESAAWDELAEYYERTLAGT
jgi:nucleoside-diphosphate-sugar epimerase